MSIFPTRILLATDGSEEAEMSATTAINTDSKGTSSLSELAIPLTTFASRKWPKNSGGKPRTYWMSS